MPMTKMERQLPTVLGLFQNGDLSRGGRVEIYRTKYLLNNPHRPSPWPFQSPILLTLPAYLKTWSNPAPLY